MTIRLEGIGAFLEGRPLIYQECLHFISRLTPGCLLFISELILGCLLFNSGHIPRCLLFNSGLIFGCLLFNPGLIPRCLLYNSGLIFGCLLFNLGLISECLLRTGLKNLAGGRVRCPLEVGLRCLRGGGFRCLHGTELTNSAAGEKPKCLLEGGPGMPPRRGAFVSVWKTRLFYERVPTRRQGFNQRSLRRMPPL
ncbi:UNVERIFIED_CONTAM: hypothetical protein Slati_3895800 [Sesamum latifolium]|uniref:Uncharacterized protein n=1 Tax=Sesamum latifolium TaxID=2727402 RepID=A0AAW2TMH8_9LAMI